MQTPEGRPSTGSNTIPGTEPDALFERKADTYLPTPIARGPWRRDALHGGAVAALLASAIDLPGRTVARVTFDLLTRVPDAPLSLVVGPVEGGARVARQTVSLLADDRMVARASCIAVRRQDLDLPAAATEPNPLDGIDVPDLTRASRSAAERIGWRFFDSAAVSVRRLVLPGAPARSVGAFVQLLVPVVAGEPISPVSRAAAAADYASSAVNRHLPFEQWSFMNAELTVHLTRMPASAWIALVSTGLIAPDGCGLTTAALFDARGRVGQAAQTLVVEPSHRPVPGTPA